MLRRPPRSTLFPYTTTARLRPRIAGSRRARDLPAPRGRPARRLLPVVLESDHAERVARAVDAEGAPVDPLIVDVQPRLVEQEDVERELSLDQDQSRQHHPEPVAGPAGHRRPAVALGGERADLEVAGPVE